MYVTSKLQRFADLMKGCLKYKSCLNVSFEQCVVSQQAEFLFPVSLSVSMVYVSCSSLELLPRLSSVMDCGRDIPIEITISSGCFIRTTEKQTRISHKAAIRIIFAQLCKLCVLIHLIHSTLNIILKKCSPLSNSQLSIIPQ